jgi:hypothetical protein
MAAASVVHPVYLPFSEAQLLEHFAPVAGRSGPEEGQRHLSYYRESVQRLAEFEAGPMPTGKDARTLIRRARQIEKDERFWVVAALMSVFHAPDRQGTLTGLLADTFGPTPPVEGLASWEEALAGDLELFFEVNLPSPPSYRSWLAEHLTDRAPVPYIHEAGVAAHERLEGPTHVDALLLCKQTGFAMLFEAKVLSDCDAKVTFDVMRNQLARNIDVMLDANPKLPAPLNTRRPDRTCFALLTPEVFKHHPHSRLYGWLLPSYQSNPSALARDLAHRDAGAGEEIVDWPAVSRRLGWVTFEDCERVAPGACGWLTSPRSTSATLPGSPWTTPPAPWTVSP